MKAPATTLFLALATAACLPPAGRADVPPYGFVALFNGKDLSGWWGLSTEDPRKWMALPAEAFKKKHDASLQDIAQHWRVEDGTITGQTTAANPAPGNTFLIWRGGKPADFELKLEFRMPDAGFANSGVQYRSREEPQKVGKWVVGGYQADMDGENQYTGILYDER